MYMYKDLSTVVEEPGNLEDVDQVHLHVHVHVDV